MGKKGFKSRSKIEAICRDKRGKIISRGFNSYDKSHPIQAHFAKLVSNDDRCYLHAEILALIRSRQTVYSIEIINHKTQVLKYPCVICQKAIEAWGVRKVIVSLKDKMT